jgi:ATP-dependent Lon protease
MNAPIAMFPLGSVLLPGSFMPLHIFEERYRRLVRDCLASGSGFGVTLISRGVEIGGGDERTSVGVIARIIEAIEFEDGRWAIGAVGTTRVRVCEWLSDDPYPRAIVEHWPDTVDSELTETLVGRVRDLNDAVTSMAIALGEPVSHPPPDIPVDASDITFALVAASPLGSADHFDLLCAPGPHQRLQLLEQRLLDQQVLYGARIAMGSR